MFKIFRLKADQVYKKSMPIFYFYSEARNRSIRSQWVKVEDYIYNGLSEFRN